MSKIINVTYVNKSMNKDLPKIFIFTKNAIEKALSKSDLNPEVLKIFMAPEFLYRGSSGAYLHDLIFGWQKTPPFDIEPPFKRYFIYDKRREKNYFAYGKGLLRIKKTFSIL